MALISCRKRRFGKRSLYGHQNGRTESVTFVWPSKWGSSLANLPKIRSPDRAIVENLHSESRSPPVVGPEDTSAQRTKQSMTWWRDHAAAITTSIYSEPIPHDQYRRCQYEVLSHSLNLQLLWVLRHSDAFVPCLIALKRHKLIFQTSVRWQLFAHFAWKETSLKYLTSIS